MEPSSLSPQSNPSSRGIDRARVEHQLELENLTLATQPLKTLKFFVLGVRECVWRPVSAAKSFWSVLFATSVLGIGAFAVIFNGPHGEHLQELSRYMSIAVWWLSLGVASSIGFGSGLHTFVLYLGPHIAQFTRKAVDCGRVDLKVAPYDTIQWSNGPSWLEKDCFEYGSPLISSDNGVIPFSHILQQVQLEAILWGIGTALGELPPYFVSRAASASGKKVEMIEELNSASSEGRVIAKFLKRMKVWFFSRRQYLNFFTILVLAAVPNPLFDLAGIMCGQFGIPFWEFFSATMIGKSILKTHIQTMIIILVCNNQLLDFVENNLISVLSFIPGLGFILPGIMSGIHILKEKYMPTSSSVPSNAKGNKWNKTVGVIWNTIVWMMLMNFVIQIITSTAQNFLKEQQEKEIAAPTGSAPHEQLEKAPTRKGNSRTNWIS